MKKIIGLIFLAMLTIPSCAQDDKTFTKAPTFAAGFNINGKLITDITSGTAVTWATLTGKPSVFPPDLTITNPLYRPISYVPTWAEITGKPTLFDGTWTSLTGKPTFATVATSGSYTDLTNQPPSIDLEAALATLGFKFYPPSTTVQINAFVVPANTLGLVYDTTLGIFKYNYNNTTWKNISALN